MIMVLITLKKFHYDVDAYAIDLALFWNRV